MNFGEIKDIIGSNIKDKNFNGVDEDDVNYAVNRACRFYARTYWWFNEEIASITLNVADPVVPNLPSDFGWERKMDGLVIVDSDSFYPLKKEVSVLYDSYNNEGSGRPWMYTWRDNELLLYFYPDQAYTLKLRYQKTVSDLVQDTDTNAFTDECPDMLIDYATYIVYMYQKDEPQQAMVYKQSAIDENRNLQKQNRELLATGSLVTESISGTRRNRYRKR